MRFKGKYTARQGAAENAFYLLIYKHLVFYILFM